MSAQHTPGRLAVAIEIFDNDGMPETALQALGGAATVAVALDFGPNNPGMRQANARRLVACWNACEGLTTEALERMGTIDRARVELDVIRVQAIKQRDELLALLREGRNDLAVAASSWNEDADPKVASFHVERVLNLITRVDAAISKVTGAAA